MVARISLIAKILLGLVYFIPMTPPPMADAGVKFMEGMLAVGYFLPLITPGAPNLVLPIVMGLCHLSAASAYKKIYSPLFSKG